MPFRWENSRFAMMLRVWFAYINCLCLLCWCPMFILLITNVVVLSTIVDHVLHNCGTTASRLWSYVLHICGHSKIKNMHITKVLCKSKERAMLLKRKSKSLFLNDRIEYGDTEDEERRRILYHFACKTSVKLVWILYLHGINRLLILN